MSKKRLEEIKNSYLVGIHSLFGTPWVSMSKENADWLIEQAEQKQKMQQEYAEDIDFKRKQVRELQERVEELEEEIKNLERQLEEQIESNRMYRQKNKRYREAIEFGIKYLKNSDIRQVQLVVTALKSALEGEE